jgi:transposase
MVLELENLPDNSAELKQFVEQLSTSFADKEVEYQKRINILEEAVRYYQGKLFGRKSERRVEDSPQEQLSFFDELEQNSESVPESNEDPTQEILVPEHKRKKRGRRPLPEDLPRIEVEHDLLEEEKVCACGSRLSRIGTIESEKLDYVPAKVQVIKHIRHKYACKACEGVEDEGATIKTAAMPPQLINQGIVTPGLLAHLITAKFADALPLYRQEKIFARLGVELSRATMASWGIQVANQCQPLLELLRKEILSGPLINMDETPVQVMKEPGRANTTKSYMWVIRGGPIDRPSLIYEYHPTRGGQVAYDYLKDYSGYVQTDGYPVYDILELLDNIILLGCWAHARRKFVEVTKARVRTGGNKKKTGKADAALNYIKKLYAVESLATQQALSFDQRVDLRRQHSLPILESFKQWLDQNAGKTPPQGLLGKAINYALGQWKKLVRYVDDGRLRLDNNLAENAIRPFVVGRKNWLFSGHPRGAHSSATFYTLIETAKANNCEPYSYLRFLFEKLPLAQTEDDYRALLPQYLDRSQLLSTPTAAV